MNSNEIINKTKVSIIVPVYKIPPFALINCINSLKQQNHECCEFLLVDDGSPDNCGKICDELAEGDERFVVIHKKNGGVSSARNIGLERSTGAYVMFVDADDLLHPEAVTSMLTFANENNLDIVLCDYKRFHDKNVEFERILQRPQTHIFKEDKEIVALRKKCLHEDSEFGIRFNGAPWGKMYSLNLINKAGFTFDTTLVRSQDNHFNFRVFEKANRIGYISEKLYYYRLLEESSVNRFRDNLFEISNTYINSITDVIKKDNQTEVYEDVLVSVKIEKLLELCFNYIRAPKNFDRKSWEIIGNAHNLWLPNLTLSDLFKSNFAIYEKVIVGLICLDHCKLASFLSIFLMKIKKTILKF